MRYATHVEWEKVHNWTQNRGILPLNIVFNFNLDKMLIFRTYIPHFPSGFSIMSEFHRNPKNATIKQNKSL
jgi:hypothetical protein